MTDKVDLAVDWLREELENSDVNSSDNFLDVGGDSLMAMGLATHLLAERGIKLNMAALFQRSIADAVASSETDQLPAA